ncbi:MAG: hypothetical protein WC807_18475 [Hyphomicrobium sp.]|jgi:hypothetical protein
MEQTDQLSPERMRAWEQRLGPDKVSKAMDIMRSHGWTSNDNPPIWAWAEVYRMVEGTQPEVWGSKSPSEQEGILGFKLF